jgi:hypothetical protein
MQVPADRISLLVCIFMLQCKKYKIQNSKYKILNNKIQIQNTTRLPPVVENFRSADTVGRSRVKAKRVPLYDTTPTQVLSCRAARPDPLIGIIQMMLDLLKIYTMEYKNVARFRHQRRYSSVSGYHRVLQPACYHYHRMPTVIVKMCHTWCAVWWPDCGFHTSGDLLFIHTIHGCTPSSDLGIADEFVFGCGTVWWSSYTCHIFYPKSGRGIF